MNKDREWNSNQCTRAREWSGRSRFQNSFHYQACYERKQQVYSRHGPFQLRWYHYHTCDTRILIGNGTGKYCKISDVSACKLSGKQKKHCLGCTPLLAMTMFEHSSRGRQLYWKHVKENSAFLDLFATLANGQCITSDQLAGLEHFVCTIFWRRQQHTVNEARKEIFGEKLEKDRKFIYLCLLPPCKLVWNYIASKQILWQRCGEMHQILF